MTDQETFDHWCVAKTVQNKPFLLQQPYVSGSADTHRHTVSVTLCYSCTLRKRLRAENVTHPHQQLFSFRVNKRNLALRVDSSVTALYFRLSVWWIIISSVGFSSQAELASRPLTCLRFIHQSNYLGLTAHSRPQDTKVTGKIRFTCSPPMISLIYLQICTLSVKQ